MGKLTVGSLFAGIGGFDLGLERAGMEVKWQVEVDPFCQCVLAKHWPHVTRYGDINKVDWATVEPVDLVCGGFPCQPVSVAGLRKVQEDERWLWPEVVRCIRVLRPRYALFENVPGLLIHGFSEVLRDLSESRYDVEWNSLRASLFGGPCRRERVFVFAFSNCFHGQERVGPLSNGKKQIFSKTHREQLAVWVQAPPSANRMDYGLPAQLYEPRVRALGNAIVPQIVEWIGRRIIEAHHESLPPIRTI